MRKLRASTAKPIVCMPVWPNMGVQAWYYTQLEHLIDAASMKLQSDVQIAWNKTPPLFQNSHITEHAAAVLSYDQALAAGIMFFCVINGTQRVLLLNRVDREGWAFPAGMVEYGENAEQAARREAAEETGRTVNEDLVYEGMQGYGDLSFLTYSADVDYFVPTLNEEHSGFTWVTVPEALNMQLHPGVRETLYRIFMAFDAPSPTKALQVALTRWAAQTIKRFDTMSLKIADDFAARNMQATQAAVLSQMKQAGFTVKFKPTRESMEAYRAVAAENVALIKSIPRKFHEQVEQKVWNAVRQGSDLSKLSKELRKAHKITVDRAALIARDQNAKAKATIERVRQQELGISRGIWIHSNAGKVPRPTHVAMDGKAYSLAQGMWDSDEGEYVHPGQLINCRCTMRPVIEGFED